MARKFFTDLDLQDTSRVIGLASPTADGDAVNKLYVDSLVQGLAWKDSARVSTQGNINLASPGATVDGITMASQDRVLVRSQTTTSAFAHQWSCSIPAAKRSMVLSRTRQLIKPWLH